MTSRTYVSLLGKTPDNVLRNQVLLIGLTYRVSLSILLALASRKQNEMSHLMTKPTKWHVRPAKTQISLGIHPVWSESSLSTWRKLGSLATHWAHSEDWSDWAEAQADLSLRWAHMPLCWFCREAAQMWIPFSRLTFNCAPAYRASDLVGSHLKFLIKWVGTSCSVFVRSGSSGFNSGWHTSGFGVKINISIKRNGISESNFILRLFSSYRA